MSDPSPSAGWRDTFDEMAADPSIEQTDEDRCDVCAQDDRELDCATLLDDSGGSALRICSDCRARLETPRCRVCGRWDAPRRRSDGLAFDGADTLPVCDDCRNSLLFERRGIA